MGGCTADPARPVACSTDADCAPLGTTAVCYAGSCVCGSEPPPQDDVILYGSDPVTLRMTSFALTCAEPEQPPPYEQCNWYTIEVTFPAALLKPGPLPKNDESVQFFESLSGPPNSSMPGDCPGGGGGGPLSDGDWTILSVDANSVTFSLANFTESFIDHDLNGTHTAERCGP